MADVHLLLPRLGAVREGAVPAVFEEPLHGKIPPADVRCGGEELLRGKNRRRPEKYACHLRDAVHVQKGGSRASDNARCLRRSGCGRGYHHARAGSYAPLLDDRPVGVGGERLRFPARLRNGRGRDFRRNRRRHGRGASQRILSCDRQKSRPRRIYRRARHAGLEGSFVRDSRRGHGPDGGREWPWKHQKASGGHCFRPRTV